MDDEELKPPARPVWVVRLVLVFAILVVLAIALMIFFPGQHGPWRHM